MTRWLWPLLLCASSFAQETAQFPRDGERVAAAECSRCHDRQHRQLQGRAHAAILQVLTLPGCETCHGPGKAHADDPDNDPALITMPAALSAGGQQRLCSQCHADQIQQHGGDPEGFLVAGMKCLDCHSVHGRPAERAAPEVHLQRRSEANVRAQPVGSSQCVTCHPVRNDLLQHTAHASLSAANSATGCESCHGNGSEHAKNGEGRWITRPDRAADGIETCRSCHTQVDAIAFHWRDRPGPTLAANPRCTTCHLVHAPALGLPGAPEPPTKNAGCAGCHDAQVRGMSDTNHWRIGAADQPVEQGCAACHLNARLHAASGGRRDQLVAWQSDSNRQAEVCLSCHAHDAELARARHGEHLRHGVSCTDCHGPMHGAHDGTADAEARCASCHADVAASFRLPNHHPVPEQRMRCSSCHDVHGDRDRRRDLDLREATCVRCHPRYRGPFVFPHQAARRDGCTICHAPHGSSNRRLLLQANTQQNCLACHGDFPAFHDQTAGSVFTNCVRCHTEVHGSDHSRYLLR